METPPPPVVPRAAAGARATPRNVAPAPATADVGAPAENGLRSGIWGTLILRMAETARPTAEMTDSMADTTPSITTLIPPHTLLAIPPRVRIAAPMAPRTRSNVGPNVDETQDTTAEMAAFTAWNAAVTTARNVSDRL